MCPPLRQTVSRVRKVEFYVQLYVRLINALVRDRIEAFGKTVGTRVSSAATIVIKRLLLPGLACSKYTLSALAVWARLLPALTD